MREPEVVASSGGYYTMLESAPEVDPARRSVSGPVTGYGAFPAPGAPGAPAPGMVPAPMMAPAPVKVRAPSGAEAWSAGLFGLLVFVPGFNALLAAVAMIVIGLWDRRSQVRILSGAPPPSPRRHPRRGLLQSCEAAERRDQRQGTRP